MRHFLKKNRSGVSSTLDSRGSTTNRTTNRTINDKQTRMIRMKRMKKYILCRANPTASEAEKSLQNFFTQKTSGRKKKKFRQKEKGKNEKKVCRNNPGRSSNRLYQFDRKTRYGKSLQGNCAPYGFLRIFQ